SVDVRRPGLHAAYVLLMQLQLGRVLDGDDALVDRNEARAHIEQRRLSGAGPAGHDDVRTRQDARLDERGGLLRHGAEPDQVADLVWILAELSNREQRAVERHRRYARVDARAIQQAGVTEWRAGVDAPSHRRDDRL